ncbi:hypothetical protein OPT61_g3860 [Boeremia exigua]|uniref:Uncharacterized protein n=1 Tax=Boeremia exigua TaxID=749465 RepID=A0ACC2IGG9_9PLEO|nr:hypothetical protein OPT61_g3860 [Boeremia exigua]
MSALIICINGRELQYEYPCVRATTTPSGAEMPASRCQRLVISILLQRSFPPFIASIETYATEVLHLARLCEMSSTRESSQSSTGSVDYVGDCSSADSSLEIAASHTWNKNRPPEILLSVHQCIKKRTMQSPHADAINSWDGNLTYGELDELSDLMIGTLRQRSVRAESVVPLCFEKSKWTVVAILAVMKMGAAFLLLDPSHPAARLKYMMEVVKADVVLCSPLYARHEAFTEVRRLVVDESAFNIANEKLDDCPNPDIDPHTALYIMFTSGTTGMPKAFTIEHSAFCSSALARASIISRDDKSRVLQFAAFTFDPCMEDMLTTLMVGGCICIPNENERVNNLAKCIRDLNANFINITPGVSDLLEPQDVPSLKILLLSGESMKESHIEKWSPHLQVINGYGPSECCIKCAVNPNMVPGTKPNNIGHPVGSSLWIVDPSNLENILPIGTEGELLIEGPTLARGYLQQNATKSFVEAPNWLKSFRNDARARVYKTGDLATYRQDGTIDFIGRRDTQAKINGQRVELAEIESLIFKITNRKHRAVVEVMSLRNEQQPILIASIASAEAPGGISREGNLFSPPRTDFTQLVEALPKELATWLPRFMIPSLFLPLQCIPLTIHGKTDRGILRSELAKLDRKSAMRFTNRADVPVGSPLSSQEEELLELWAQVLGVRDYDRQRNLNFFQLGGDSFAAIRLVTAARHKNLHLTVADILQNPQLSHQACRAVPLEFDTQTAAIKPFSLSGVGVEELLSSVATQCSLDKSAIEDIYPCTPLQSYWIEYTLSHQDELQALWVYQVPRSVDISRLQRAWEGVVSENPILRSRAVKVNGRYMQAAIDEKVVWEEWTSLNNFLAQRTPHNFYLGQPLTRPAIIVDKINGEQYFALVSHHSAWDGWSRNIVFQRLADFYMDAAFCAPKVTPFTRLLRQVQLTNDESYHRFWSSQLSNLTLTPFFQKPANQPTEAKAYSFKLSIPRTDRLGSITLSTVVQAAWALVVHERSSTDDVVLTVLLSGREFPLVGVEEIVAPTVAQVPLRISIDRQATVNDWLQDIQRRLIGIIPFMHADWEIFRTQLGNEVRQAWESSPLLVIHPISEGESENTDFPLGLKQVERRFAHKIPFTIECYVESTMITTDIFYDEKVFGPTVMHKLCGRFETFMRQIIAAHNGVLEDLMH